MRSPLKDQVPDLDAIFNPDEKEKRAEYFDLLETIKSKIVDESIIHETVKLYSELDSDDYQSQIFMLILLKNMVKCYDKKYGEML